MRAARTLLHGNDAGQCTTWCELEMNVAGRLVASDTTAVEEPTRRPVRRSSPFRTGMMELCAVVVFPASPAWAVCVLPRMGRLALRERRDPLENAGRKTARTAAAPPPARMAEAFSVAVESLRMFEWSRCLCLLLVLRPPEPRLWLLSLLARRQQQQHRVRRGARRPCLCYPALKSARPLLLNFALIISFLLRASIM